MSLGEKTVSTRTVSTQAGQGRRPPFESAPSVEFSQGHYRLRFAQSEEELDEILRLRFDVFNVELGEGLEESFSTGRDRDDFDENCHHLLVTDDDAGAVIGTYRMQTAEMARNGIGFYSADEFRLDQLPPEVVARSVEIGRACIAREHRNRRVLFLLWRGLAAYLAAFGKRFLFGCCSLTSQDPAEGQRLYRQLRREGYLHPDLRLHPAVGLECDADGSLTSSGDDIEVPRLFATYLRYGARMLGPPAIDRRFKTIDYFVLLDVESLDEGTFRTFFG